MALVVAALAVLSASAPAAGWVNFSPVTGNPGGGRTVSQPKIVADAGGNQLAVWLESPAPFKVMAAYRPAGGAWGGAQALASTATTLPNTDLAVDAKGNFIVVYSELTTSYKVFARYLPAGQPTLGAAEQLGITRTNPQTISAPAVDFDGAGTAFAVYGINGATAWAGKRPAGAGSAWTQVSTGLATDSASPDIAVSGLGEATIADYPIGGGALRHWRLLAGAATWTALTTPAGAGNPTGRPIIEVDGQGRTTTLHLVASTFTGIASQTCPAGTASPCNAKSPVPQLAATTAGSPALAVDSAGNAVAAWTDGTGTAPVAVSRRSGFSGAWSPRVEIGQGAGPALAYNSGGTAFAVYEQSTSLIKFVTAPAGGAFAPPSGAITDPAGTWVTPKLAADASQNVFGVWSQSAGAGIQSAVYDAEPPTAPAIAAISGAVAGIPVTLSATASDVWSGVTYGWEFGDGATASGASASHSYTSPGTYSARVTATDGAGNQRSQTQTVAVAAPAQGQQPIPGLPRPVAGKTVNVEPVSGTVLVRLPGAPGFVPLASPTQIQNGSIIDARKGRVRITIDNGLGGLDTAEFYGGIFRFTQPKVKAGRRWFANLYLYGGRFKGCARAPRKPKVATLSGKKKSKRRSVRHLWGSGKGAFRTVGRFSSATVRGTKWLTDDRCNGTLTKVTVGKVAVRDFARNRTIIVKARKKYFAQPRARKAARAKKKR